MEQLQQQSFNMEQGEDRYEGILEFVRSFQEGGWQSLMVALRRCCSTRCAAHLLDLSALHPS